MADPEGVCVAFDDAMLEPTPTWTRIDDIEALGVRVSSYTIKRGRRTEFDKTDAGTSAFAANDMQGLFDPTNTGSPYYGNLDGKQAAIALHNPVTDSWHTIYRGFIDEWRSDMEPSQNVVRVDCEMSDGLDYLAGVEMAPGTAGDPPLTGEDAGFIYFPELDSDTIDRRIHQALGNGGWPDGLIAAIFTGNVRPQRTSYSPGETLLTVIDDAAEAEFPGVANRWIDREGLFTFHGRLARFTPDDFGIPLWHLGDGSVVAGDPGKVQIRGLAWSRSRNTIINAALCNPYGILDSARDYGYAADGASQAQYGVHTWSAEDLVILNSALTGNNARDECLQYATYYVAKYAQPLTRIDKLVVKSLPPDDVRADSVWNFLCNVDISHRVHLNTAHPGGGGFDDTFFVEGLAYTVNPAQPEYADVTLEIDVSPSSPYDYSWA